MTNTLTATAPNGSKMDRGTRNLWVSLLGTLVLSSAVGISQMPALFNRAADNAVQPVQNPVMLNLNDGKCYRELGPFEGAEKIQVMCPTERSQLASNSSFVPEQANLN